jgi:hypothetical protein
MPESAPSREKLLQVERTILAALCGANRADGNALQELNSHAWQSPEHEIVFAAIRKFQDHGHGPILEFLRAEATRRGFPELDWAEFVPKPVSDGELAGLMEELRRTPREES